ncbi:hypothetical protein D3C71_1216910 [compost metagenome]
MDDQPGVALVEIEAPTQPEPHHQLQHRDNESTGEHQAAPRRGRQRLDASQVIQRLDPWSLVTRPVRPTGTPFAVEHEHHHQQ